MQNIQWPNAVKIITRKKNHNSIRCVMAKKTYGHLHPTNHVVPPCHCSIRTSLLLSHSQAVFQESVPFTGSAVCTKCNSISWRLPRAKRCKKVVQRHRNGLQNHLFKTLTSRFLMNHGFFEDWPFESSCDDSRVFDGGSLIPLPKTHSSTLDHPLVMWQFPCLAELTLVWCCQQCNSL